MEVQSPVSPTVRNATDDINIRMTRVQLSPGLGTKRPFFNRTFGKLEKGSVRGSIFSLCACAIGAGILSLPYVLALNGWVIGMALILIGAVAGNWSLSLIAESTCLFFETNNLSKLALRAGGRKLRILLDIMIIIYLFGACISYQIITTSLVQFIVIQIA